MVRLALHRSNARILEEEPVVCLIELLCAAGIGELVLCVVAVDEVLLDASGFEDGDGCAVREGVCECGNAAVGVYGEVPGLFVLNCGQVYVDLLVR
jgi:hypothetical protein